MDDEFNEDAYAVHKANWDAFFNALVAVGMKEGKPTEETDAFWNAMEDRLFEWTGGEPLD